MRSQQDVAVALGLIPEPLPPILTWAEMMKNPPPVPPLLIDGILHQGCKMVLGGTSKANKTWCLLDLALSVATGQKWWGRQCKRASVVYINFELSPWTVYQRISAICAARAECRDYQENLSVWNLRGHSRDISNLRDDLERDLLRDDHSLLVLDPAYKLLGTRDENSNGDIASLLNELEKLACTLDVGIVIAHHFAKGDASAKTAVDRLSGAGVWARDPDSLLVVTPHEEESSFTVSCILRCLPPMEDFVVTWNYPAMKVNPALNPDALRTPQTRQKVCSDKEFMELLRLKPLARGAIVAAAQEIGVSRGTTDRYLKRLSEAGRIRTGGGLYWLPEA